LNDPFGIIVANFNLEKNYIIIRSKHSCPTELSSLLYFIAFTLVLVFTFWFIDLYCAGMFGMIFLVNLMRS